MNLTVFAVIVATSFISGVLRVKYVPDSYKATLLSLSIVAGLLLGVAIPPRFNMLVSFIAVVMGSVPVLARIASGWIRKWQVARAARPILEKHHG